MIVHFIADLHLDPAGPASLAAFQAYLAGPARSADTLYILGDLFEYWIGDDDESPLGRTVANELKTLSEHGTAIRFMAGNRDFLLGQRFARMAGMQLLDDPSLIDLGGMKVALTHGDLLCTDDHAYQQFRRQVRDLAWQRAFLEKSLPERRDIVANMRTQSTAATRDKDMDIMDVNEDAVTALFRRLNRPSVLIQGHTHRPARHQQIIDGRSAVRWVLSDWRGNKAPYLCWNGNTFQAVDFPSQ